MHMWPECFAIKSVSFVKNATVAQIQNLHIWPECLAVKSVSFVENATLAQI